MRIGIGIDTGGTCTDAVAYDFDTATVLAKGKALTTREDLTIGIGQALDNLPAEIIRDATLISLSTTLATNACVENKGARAKLVIYGLNEDYMDRIVGETNFELKTDNVRCFDTHGSADGMIVDQPDWETVLPELRQWLIDADALAAAEIYSMNNGAPCEKQTREFVESNLEIPFVSANELSSQINVLERGATALLNARLLPIVQEFVAAVLADFSARDCQAPIMIVRSDGSLMSANLSLARPVETILSGPAASVLAGRNFTDTEDYIIIDMGGTTTDISVVHNYQPVMADEGILIGGWQTHVKGVFVDTFALGGDSNIRIVDDQVVLLQRRVMPICVAAERWPEVKPMLSRLLASKRRSHFPLHEFYYLVKEPADRNRYSKDELALIDALKEGPVILDMVMEAIGVDLYNLKSERLEQEGIVMRCGLTPTDFMHLKGDYLAYDPEPSLMAARFLLHNLWLPYTQENIDNLADYAYTLVEGRMYENLLRILVAQQFGRKFAKLDPQTDFLIHNSWENRGDGNTGLFRYLFGTKASLVGIGAPTHVFLPEVAKALGTDYIYPEHAEVANAIGALKADIRAVARVEISKIISWNSGIYYVVHAPSGAVRYDDLNEALEAARAASIIAAQLEARARGALGELAIETNVGATTTSSKEGPSVALSYSAESVATVRFGL
ncbi:MAG: hydantoinase/oxoprolinase family protein [Coriobacteriales bacterium]|jgi:N-methylhydantoinase A/oxoprolinase/acetone carboxylase beta subunit|nr:hydantoinase/oxoprolinase family protein [Coriobacteriales bacterium]